MESSKRAGAMRRFEPHGHDVGQTGARRTGDGAERSRRDPRPPAAAPVAVGELLDHQVDRLVLGRGGGGGRQLLIGLEPKPLAVDVVLGDARVERQLEPQLLPVSTSSPRNVATASPIMRRYRSNPTPAMWPACSAPSSVAGAAELEVLQRHLPCPSRGRCSPRWSAAGPHAVSLSGFMSVGYRK